MVDYPEFHEFAQSLRPFRGAADLGLHFSLTSSRSIASVALECHLRPPPLSTMLDAVERQVERFSDAMGMVPDYIDGHQHVHVLPVVRDAVIHVAKRIGAYVRIPLERIDAAMLRRPAPIESIYLARASRILSRLAQSSSVPANRGFRGVRTFREKTPFGPLFERMIANVGEGCLVMCHPGHIDTLLASRDGLLEPRAVEWRYFSGSDFPVDLANAGLTLSRLREAIPQAFPAR
jgi:predicted glycoside hydrolase/deacetylase ChbG (UPF0249 family)